ncbi:hypothetical protein BN133_2439 [Cronobacter dublinensis 582]|nr:hypothetical protein BN133_2439 [Cronobacter dublinensis 582]
MTSTLMRGFIVAAIDNALFARAPCEQRRQQQRPETQFHRRVFTAVPLTLTMSMLPSLPTVS